MRKDKEWKIVDLFIAILIMFIISGIFFILEGRFHTGYNRIPKQLFSVINSLLATTSGTIYLTIKYPIDLSHFGFNNENIKKTIAWGVFAGLVVSFINFPLKIIIGENKIPTEIFINVGVGKCYVFFFLSIVVVLIPFVEEMFYRACVYRMLRNRFDMFWGYVGSTTLFTLGHVSSRVGAIIFYIISSLILTYIYEKTNLIGTSIIAHIVLNLTWYAAVYSHHMGLILI